MIPYNSDQDQNDPKKQADKKFALWQSVTKGGSKLRRGLFGHPKRNLLILSGVLVMMILELFTPLAPVERGIGFWVSSMPNFALSLIVGKKEADRFQNVKNILSSYSQQNTIYDTNNKIITISDNLSPTPPFLKRYLIDIENDRFYDTFVIDWPSVLRAAATDISKRRFTEGASGIIQQFARGIILQNDSKYWRRKVKEALISYGLASRYSHRQLLGFYMSSVFLGSFSSPAIQIRGVKRGAEDLFGKQVTDISKPEGLALVTLIGSPNTYLKNRTYFRKRYLRLANALKIRSKISQKEYRELVHNIPVIDTSKVKSRALKFEFREQIAGQLEAMYPKLDDTAAVHTTIDLHVTSAARRALTSAVETMKKQTGITDLDGFMVVAHYDSLLALIGSVQTGDKYMNNLNIRSAWRPGSLVKPFIYSEYIKQGGNIYQKLPAKGPKTFNITYGTWTVKNYSPLDNYPPKQTAINALARSNNVAAAYLAINYGDSLLSQLQKAGSDSTFSPYPATFIGADAPKPMNLFRLLQTYVPPYGKFPDHLILVKNDTANYRSLFTREVARETAYCLTFALKNPRGTLHFTENYYNWNDANYLGKTGTAQKSTSAGLFIVRPNGVSVLMGVFSRSGKSLRYLRGGSIQGASLAPFMQQFFEAPSIKKRIKGRFHFGYDEFDARKNYYVGKVKNFFKKVTSVSFKKLWNSLVGNKK